MKKKIFIVILIVAIIAVAAVYMFGHNSKQDTQIKFLSENTLKNGDQLDFEVKDTQGNPIRGKQVNLTFGNEKYSLVTDDQGKGHLIINNQSAGKYNVTVDYGGDDTHNGCSAKTTIIISDDSTAVTSSTNITTSNSTSSNITGNNSSTVKR